MNRAHGSSFSNLEPYVPRTLGDIGDFLGSMVLGAPTFVDKSGHFPERTIDSEFQALLEGVAPIRKKLGEERFAKLVDHAARGKALFADDQDDRNGKTDEGRELSYEMEDLIDEVRSRRRGDKI